MDVGAPYAAAAGGEETGIAFIRGCTAFAFAQRGPREAIECDLRLEMLAVPDLRAGIAFCESVGDYTSRELLGDILESEEEHIDWLETQIDLIARVGEAAYLQSKIRS